MGGGSSLENSLERRITLDSLIEGVRLRNVRHDHVVQLVLVFLVRREELLGLLDAANGDAHRVAVGEEDVEDVRWIWSVGGRGKI